MSIRYLSLSLRSSIKGEDRIREGVTQDGRDFQNFNIFVHSSCLALYLLPVFSLCFVHVTQSIIISIILLDSHLKFSRVIPLSSVASVVNLSCHSHLQNGSSISAFNSGQCSHRSSHIGCHDLINAEHDGC